MQRQLLFLGYYLVIVPAGLLCRMIRDPLHRAFRRRAPSYWVFPAGPGPLQDLSTATERGRS
jgi:hypothetical protein